MVDPALGEHLLRVEDLSLAPGTALAGGSGDGGCVNRLGRGGDVLLAGNIYKYIISDQIKF